MADKLSNTLSDHISTLETKFANFNPVHTAVNANTSFVLNIDDNTTYLISHMTSSDSSARLILIMRRTTSVKMFEIAKGSWQSYYTETLADNKWTFANGNYYTVINYIKF